MHTYNRKLVAASIQLMSHRSSGIQTNHKLSIYTFNYNHLEYTFSFIYKALNNVYLRRLTPHSKFITEYLELGVCGGLGSGSEGGFSVTGAILYTGSDEGGDEELCTCSTSEVLMLFLSCDTLRSCRCLTKVKVCCERDAESLKTFSNCKQAKINTGHKM